MPLPAPVPAVRARPRPVALREAPPARPRLRVVDDRRLRHAARRRRTRLVVVAASLVAVGSLFALAAFHAMLVAGQVRLDALEERVAEEQARYQELRLEVAGLESPTRIVDVAQQRLGMVPPDDITYLSPSGPTAASVAAAAARPDEPDAGRGSGGQAPWAAVKPYLAGTP